MKYPDLEIILLKLGYLIQPDFFFEKTDVEGCRIQTVYFILSMESISQVKHLFAI